MMGDATQEHSASLSQVVGRTVMANEEQAIRLDLDSTRRNFDGDANLIRDIGFIFIEDVPLLIQRLATLRMQLLADASRESAVLEEARRLAHSLKGLAGTFGAEPLGGMLAEIEQQPQRLVALDGEQRLQELERVAQQTITELTKCLDNHSL